MSPSSEENDLDLLEQVEMKFGLAATDEQLQSLIGQFLCPILRKSGTSPHPSVKTKVVGLLSHLLTRISSASSTIKIPGSDLVKIIKFKEYEAESSFNLAKTLSLKVLDSLAVKLPIQEQAELIPELISGLDSKDPKSPISVGAVRLIIQLIPQAIQLPTLKEPPQVNPYNEANLNFLCDRLYRFQLKGWNILPSSPPNSTLTFKQYQAHILTYLGQPINRLPKWPWPTYKVFLAASVTQSKDINEMADSALKRVEKPDLENIHVLKDILNMYLDKEDATNPLKCKILEFISRSMLSVQSAALLPEVFKVIFDSLHGTNWDNKLRVRGLTLLQWLIRNREVSFLTLLVPVFLPKLSKILDEHRNKYTGDDFNILREGDLGSAYVTLGLLAAKAYAPFQSDYRLLARILDDLELYKESVPQIKDCLNLLLVAHQKAAKEEVALDKLGPILEQNFYSNNPTNRQFALRFLCGLFPSDHHHKQFLCILGTGDQDPQVREFANSGLANSEYKLSPLELVEYTHHQLCQRPLPAHLCPGHGEALLSKHFPPLILQNFLQYLHKLINPGETQAQEQEARTRLKGLLSQEIESGELSLRLQILIEYLRAPLATPNATHRTPLQEIAAKLLTLFIGCYSSELIDFLARDILWLQQMAHQGSTNQMLKAYAIVLVGSIPDDTPEPVGFLTKSLSEWGTAIVSDKLSETKKLHAVEGLGLLVGRFRYRFPAIEDADITSAIDQLITTSQSPSSALACAAMIALQEVGRYRPLPNLKFDLLLGVLRTTSNPKLAEATLLTLGHLGVGDPSLSPSALNALLDLPYPINKRVEVYFRAGEAMACLASRWRCPIMLHYLDTLPGNVPESTLDTESPSLLGEVVNQLLIAAQSPTPNKRKGAAFCLLSVVQLCHTDPDLTPHLPVLHSTLMGLLSSPDELVQEVASTGMGLIYNHTPEKERGSLVQSLITLLTTGQSTANVPQSDTDLFTSQPVGRAPDGTPINTYRSVMSLAADMNQPELIYPFLQLARSNAIWSSRQGAAFGLTQLIGPAKDLIAPYIDSFLPKLYRFRYDPDVKIAQTMSAIWNVLTNEERGSELLDKHFSHLAKDLLLGMGDRSWRTRQSSATALSELLHGRKDVDFSSVINQVWLMSFRALDDIKESVRDAGLKACQSSLAITLKLVDSEQSTISKSQPVIDAVLPFLLDKGLCSDAEVVRTFSLDGLLKIIKSATKGTPSPLQSHLAATSSALIDAMTSFEPPAINYITFHTDKYDLSPEELDGHRLDYLKRSPISQAIMSSILPLIKSAEMAELAPELVNRIKRSVGFPTKAGCARLIAGLATTQPTVLSSHLPILVKAIVGSGLTDNSLGIRKLWASTLGISSKLLDEPDLAKLLSQLTESYLQTEEGQRVIYGFACQEISKRGASLNNLRQKLLPIAFFGQLDIQEETAQAWLEVWQDHTTGSSAALALYLPHILNLIIQQITDTTRWSTKKQGALALTKAAKLLGPGLPDEWRHRLLTLVLEQLGGRVWEGKEAFLEALGQLASNTPPSDIIPQITQTLLSSMKKKALPFKTKAIEVATITLPQLNPGYKDIAETLTPYLLPSNENIFDDDLVYEAHMRPRILVLKSHSIKCLFAILPPDITSLTAADLELLDKILSSLTMEPWNVRIALLESIKVQLLPKLPSLKNIQPIWTALNKVLVASLNDAKYLQLRLLAVDIIRGLSTLESVVQNPDLLADVSAMIAQGLKDTAPQVSERLREIEIRQ